MAGNPGDNYEVRCNDGQGHGGKPSTWTKKEHLPQPGSRDRGRYLLVTGRDGTLASHTGPYPAPWRGAPRSTNDFESVLMTGPIHNAAAAPEMQTMARMMESTLL